MSIFKRSGHSLDGAAYYTVPETWIESVNNNMRVYRLEADVLRQKLAALAAHLQLEFVKVDAQPAHMAVTAAKS